MNRYMQYILSKIFKPTFLFALDVKLKEVYNEKLIK